MLSKSEIQDYELWIQNIQNDPNGRIDRILALLESLIKDLGAKE